LAEQQQRIAATAESFASACNTINQTVNPKLTNRNSIQAVFYHDIKKESGLTANHVVTACARVVANRLTAKHKGKQVKSFKPTRFDCDARTFRFFEKDWSVTISTDLLIIQLSGHCGSEINWLKCELLWCF
jgi:hypothetical protein